MKKSKAVNSVVNGALAAAVLLASSSVLAYETGDMILRVGAASVQPDDSSSALKIDAGAVGGSEAGVKHGEAVGITFAYMLDPHWGVELLVATPFDHDISANLGDGDWLSAGSTKHLPPTLSLQFFPMEADSRWQPYIGIGVNYTTFFEEDIGGDLDAALGGGDMELDDSWGMAFQLGMDYQINDNWLLNAAVWKMDIDTDVKITPNQPNFLETNTIKTSVDIDPLVYMLSLGYKF